MDFQFKDRYGMDDLLQIMQILRGPDGCPWDREQTHRSIRKNLIEETYEACEAIDLNDADLLKEELGDVLLQVVFHAQMEQDAGGFAFADVVDGICQKLIVRHPHVFGDIQVDNSDQVLENWDKIKRAGKGQKTHSESLKSVCAALPALMRAQKVQQRAAKSGFEYKDAGAAFGDLKSELAELDAALTAQDAENTAEELGDLLFAAVNVSRFVKADAEELLSKSTDKFVRRFEAVETLAAAQGIDLHTADVDTMDSLWRQAKNQGNS